MTAIQQQKKLRAALVAQTSVRRRTKKAPPIDQARRLGDILIDLGCIDQAGVEHIIAAQKKYGRQFGWTAGKLGLLTTDDLQTAIGIQNGYLRADRSALSLPSELVVIRRSFSPEAEQFRLMRTRLLTTQPAEKLKVLSIIEAHAGVKADKVAINLAASFAQLKRRVLLIDAQLRQPRIGPLFKAEPQEGLAGLLADKARIEDAVEETAVNGLFLLQAGLRVQNPQELLAGDALHETIEQARSSFDMVMVLTAGLGPVADSQFVWSETKSAIVVARRDVTRADQLKELHVVLRQLGAETIGSVMTK